MASHKTEEDHQGANCTDESRTKEKTGSISTALLARKDDQQKGQRKKRKNRRNPDSRRSHPTVVEGLRGVRHRRTQQTTGQKSRDPRLGATGEKLQADAGERDIDPDAAELR